MKLINITLAKISGNIKKGHLPILIDQIICSGSNFLLAIYYARNLGPTEFGYYGLILFFGYLLVMLQNGLIGTMILINVNKYKVNINNYKVYIIIKFFLMVVFLIVFIFLLAYSKIIPRESYLYLLSFLIFYILHDLLKKYLHSTFKISRLLRIDLIYYLSVCAFLYFYNINSHIDVLSINVMGFFVAFITAAKFKLFEMTYSWRKIKVFFRAEYHSIKHLLTSSSMQWFNSRIAYYILAMTGSIQNVGIINAYMSIIGVFNPVFIAIDNYTIPRAAKKMNGEGIREANHFVKNIVDKFLIPMIFITLAMIIFRNELIFHILGEEYIEFAHMFSLLLIVNLLIYCNKRYVIMANLLRKQQFLTYAHFINFIIVVIASYFLITLFGIAGLVVMSLINASVLMYFLRLKLKTHLKNIY